MNNKEKKFLKDINKTIDSNMDFSELTPQINFDKYEKKSRPFIRLMNMKVALSGFILALVFVFSFMLVQDNNGKGKLTSTTVPTPTVSITTTNNTTTTTVSIDNDYNKPVFSNLGIIFNQHAIYNMSVSQKYDVEDNSTSQQTKPQVFDFYEMFLDESNVKKPQLENNKIIISSSLDFLSEEYVNVYKITIENNEYKRVLIEDMDYEVSNNEVKINLSYDNSVSGYYVQVGLIYKYNNETFISHIGSLILFE